MERFIFADNAVNTTAGVYKRTVGKRGIFTDAAESFSYNHNILTARILRFIAPDKRKSVTAFHVLPLFL